MGAGGNRPWFQYVQIPTKAQKLQVVVEAMEQEQFWKHFSKHPEHRKPVGGDPKHLHLRIQNYRSNERGGEAPSIIRRKKKARGNSMEAKIQSTMAQGRGKEHKNIPSLHDTHTIHKSHHKS